MTEFLIISILVILFGALLYWAYLPDFKRNPKEFKRTLIAMPIGIILGGLGYKNSSDKLRKWSVDDAQREPKEIKDNKPKK